ncbi:MAG: PEP-CTERM sorting domain-containing protein [Verrucomicrobiota bacterium]
MKLQNVVAASFVATLATAPGALTFNPGYGGSAFYTHTNSDSVISYDWGSDGKLYYMTSAGFPDVAVWQRDGASINSIYSNSNNFVGASVVALNSSIYFNDSDTSNNQFIRRYDIGAGTVATSALTNFALGTDGTNLLSTGSAAGGGTDILSYANGDLLTASINLGTVNGFSGPIAFDSSGNLFYAPGFGDASIYRWSAAEVSTALAGGQQLTATGNLWYDYSSDFAGAGATSLLVNDVGEVYLTITDFVNPSNFVRFDSDALGFDVVASSTGRLGEIRIREGELFVSDGNQIFNVVPEPSAMLLSLISVGAVLLRRRR